MKSVTKNQESLRSRLVAEAKDHTTQATEAARTACSHALLAGMRLIVIHAGSVEQGSRNDLVPRGTKSGFEAALEDIGLPKRTAYRWMSATVAAAERLGTDRTEFPSAPGTPAWKALEKGILKLAQGMSLNRLILGAAAANSDDHRQDELITRAESGDDTAESVLEQIAAGKLTLVQAIRAASGALATKDKTRKDPVYLDLNPTTGQIDGLYVKSIKTLTNTFRGWDKAPAPARKKARDLWLDLVAELPADLHAR